MSEHKGRKYLVTGGGRGIGRAVVEDLHSKGAIVYALSKNPDNLKDLQRKCPGVKTICVDLGDWDATQKALSSLEAVDCLINNAAVHRSEDFLSMTSETFDLLFNVNLKAVINVSQIVAKKMIERGKGGAIVNVSSIGSKAVFTTGIGYCMTKAALEMLNKSLAVQLGPHKITVNSVCPAAVDTDMLKQAEQGGQEPDEEIKKHMEKILADLLNRTPTRTFHMPMSDVVNAILFFGSGTTSQITGSSISVDGGYLAS